MKSKIRNVDDLMNEIARLDVLKEDQEEYLGAQYSLLRHKVEAPARFINMLVSNVPGVGAVKGVVSAVTGKTISKDSDWLTKILQLATPLLLNRTVLKNSGWLKKALVLLASETAVSKVNKANVGSVVSGIANFIRPKKNKKNKEALVEPPEITAEEAVESNQYGIPKDSETY